MHDGEFDDEVNNLIEWCEDLDYEKYTENWHEIATSNQAEVPAETIKKEPFKITGAELGGFTLEHQQILALQQELTQDGVQLEPTVTQAMIDQSIAQIQKE